MKLLVTGGAGFIGSHFVRIWLDGHPDDEIVTLDRLAYAGVCDTVDELRGHPRHRFVQGDICDAGTVAAAMAGCDAVVHFAAETHVDRSITNPAPFVRTNVEGTQVLLRGAVDAKLRRFLHVSTDEVYGPILEGEHTEQAPLKPRSPYAASKAAGDLMVRAFQETYQLPVVTVRPTNAYGPRQFPEKFIPLSITNAMQDRPLGIYGDGLQRRRWLHVEDLCRGVACVFERGALGEVYNIGSPAERTNLDVARALLTMLKKPAELIRFVADRPGHDRRYGMDDRRLAALGWRPEIGFEEGLERTIAWYRDHPGWWQPLAERLREDSYHWLNRAAGAGPRQAAERVS